MFQCGSALITKGIPFTTFNSLQWCTCVVAEIEQILDLFKQLDCRWPFLWNEMEGLLLHRLELF